MEKLNWQKIYRRNEKRWKFFEHENSKKIHAQRDKNRLVCHHMNFFHFGLRYTKQGGECVCKYYYTLLSLSLYYMVEKLSWNGNKNNTSMTSDEWKTNSNNEQKHRRYFVSRAWYTNRIYAMCILNFSFSHRKWQSCWYRRTQIIWPSSWKSASKHALGWVAIWWSRRVQTMLFCLKCGMACDHSSAATIRYCATRGAENWATKAYSVSIP